MNDSIKWLVFSDSGSAKQSPGQHLLRKPNGSELKLKWRVDSKLYCQLLNIQTIHLMKAMKKDSVVGNKSLSKWYKNVAHLPWVVFLEKQASTVSGLTSQFLLIITKYPATHI